MKHSFKPSQLDADKCLECRYNELAHSDSAECEACTYIGPCEIFKYHTGKTSLLCPKHYEEEEIADSIAYQAPELQEARLQASRNNNHSPAISLIEESNKIDQSIQLISDLFNAHTKSIVEITQAIDSDESIQNKPFTKAETVFNRVKHFQQILFDAKQAQIDAENAIRAGQVYLNEIAKQLRQEERDKIRVEDISYPAKTPKVARAKSTSTGTKKPVKAKLDFVEVNKYAAKVGLDGNVLHMRMIKFNCSALEAAKSYAEKAGLTITDWN
jgi:hypothetical protein